LIRSRRGQYPAAVRARPLAVAVALTVALGALAGPRVAGADEPPAPASQPASPPAAESEAERAARAHYDEGLTQYHLGHFEAAVTEFKLAYELSKKPKLLFNVAQALRLAGHDEEAIYFYRTYLRLVPDAPNAADVDEFIAASQHALRAAEARRHAAADSERLERTRAAQAQARAEREHRLHRAGLITAGAGVAAAGVGTFFAVRAANAASDLTSVADAGGAWTDELTRKQRDGERDDAIGTSLLVAGGTAVLAGLVLYTWGLWHVPDEPGPGAGAAPVAVTPALTVGSGGASLWLDVSF
jgi:tetratricopeptide (TPR) repeat protein